MIIATWSSRNYDWTTLAQTEEAANEQLRKAFERHADQFPAGAVDLNLIEEAIADGEVNYSTITTGVVLRDGETI